MTGSWDFGLINHHYQDALDQAERGLEVAQNPSAKSARLRQWLAAERETWMAAITTDPLLPTSLLPTDYLGLTAWQRRQAVFGSLAERLTAMAHNV